MSCLESLTHMAHRAVASALAVAATGFAVDCTAGNGHDTLFLAGQLGEHGQVWAFDVQEAALRNTRARLSVAGLERRVSLIAQGHESLAAHLPPRIHGQVAAIMFNLGFLPGSDRSRVTRGQTTLAALESSLGWLAPQGLLSVHCYTGHAGGDEESKQVYRWFKNLPWQHWRVARYDFMNKEKNREFLLLAEKNTPAPALTPQRAPA